MTNKPKKVAVFYDRDGVITSLVPPSFNRGPLRMSEFSLVESPQKTLKAIYTLGYLNLVVTNQPDISRGTLSPEVHEEICSEVLRLCPSLTKIYVCPHDNLENCLCRKPRPGLLDLACQDFNIDLHESWIVGDKWTDILAGQARGLKTVLLRNEYSWLPTSQGDPPPGLSADFEISRLSDLPSLLNYVI